MNNPVEDDSSAFDPFPDDLVLQIIRKIVDLEAFCPCKLVSKRFYRITHQVDTIRFITKPSTSFRLIMPAIESLRKFKRLKSLSIHIPTSPKNPPVKWKVNFGKKLDSLLVLSPNSVYHSKECVDENSDEEEDTEINKEKYYTAMSWLDHAMTCHVILLNCIARLPLLEKATFTDSIKTCRIAIDAEKIAEMRKALTLQYETVRRNRVKKCYVPLLELPVSGYVMKGVTLYIMERVDLPDNVNYTSMETHDYDSEDKEEAAYSEAVAEIFKKHSAQIKKQADFTSVTFFN